MNTKLVYKIADRIINGNDTNWNMNINHFDWVPGVGLYGIFNAYKATGDERYLKFLIDWANTNLDDAFNQKTVNSTAPLLTVIELYNITKNENYLNTCNAIAQWIINEAPLTREGGLEHTVTENVDGFSEQIWADTLFMVCLFLAKLGKCTNDKRYIDFSLKQLKIHFEVLQDKKTGLCYHGWNCKSKDHMSGVYWGRANAWIVYSSAEILSIVEDFIDRSIIEECLKTHINALKNVQRKNGAFGTVLDDETSYDEISATGGITAGIKKATTLGIVDKSYLSIWEKGVNAVEANVLENGDVDGVSTGTPIMPTKEAYKQIEICPTLYGQSLAILALTT